MNNIIQGNGEDEIMTDNLKIVACKVIDDVRVVAHAVKIVTRQQPGSSRSPAGAVCDCSYNRYDFKDFSGYDAAQACNDYCILLGNGVIPQLD